MGKRLKYNYTDTLFLLEVEGYARDGFDNAQVAKLLCLNPTYFSGLISKYPEISEALKKGRRPLNVLVENSLYKRATGLKVKSQTRRWIEEDCSCKGKDESCIYCNGTGKLATNKELVMETETELPPDTGAAMAWLKNRKPDQWNKQPSKVDLTSDGKSIVWNETKVYDSDKKTDHSS